jgi:hypothetical protein
MRGNMRKVNCLLAILLLMAAMLPVISGAEEVKQEEKPTGELAVSTLSGYIWRGQELTRSSVVVQPSATIAYKDFSFNVWGNLDTKPYSAVAADYGGKYTETDFTVSYTKKLGIFQVTPGYIYYALGAPYSGAVAPLDSQEVFVTVGLNTLLSPTLTAYKEIDHYHQWYFLLGVSHALELSKMVSLKLAATASYLKSEDEATYARYDSNSLATTDKYNNFHDGTISVSLPVALSKALTVTPTVSYVFPLCDDAKYEMKGRGLQGAVSPSDRNSSFFYGGVNLSFTF